MFFHPLRNTDDKKVKIPSAKDMKAKSDAVGLKPIAANAPILAEFRNDFGWLRNDIQLFLRTSDPTLQAAITKNMQVVNQKSDTSGMTVQDCYDSIIPNTVQTPADIARFGRVMEKRFEGRISRNTPISDLTEKVHEDSKNESADKIDVAPEV